MGLHAGIICLRVRNFGGGPSSSVVGPQASLVVPWLSGFFTSGVISLGLWAGCLVLCAVSLVLRVGFLVSRVCGFFGVCFVLCAVSPSSLSDVGFFRDFPHCSVASLAVPCVASLFVP